ncbi:MAG: CBS domain-containing protein [Gammaproteobacteria bacterium]|nr:CBS domain-containing protein [Gammaproteobacteria bacterium]
MTVQRLLDSQKSMERTYVSPDASIREVLGALASRNVGALVVSTDGETVEGIISERDIVRGLNKLGAELLDKSARELMTGKVVTCRVTDRAAGVMAIMVSKHLRHMPVVEDGKLVSMLSIRDLLNLRLIEVQSEADAMRHYIAGDV